MTVPEPRELSVGQLAALDAKAFTTELRVRLRRDDYWAILLEPSIIERTRYTLVKIIASVDAQRLRAAQEGTTTEHWLRAINALQRWSQERLNAMPPAPEAPLVPSNRETRAWKGFSARLAEELERVEPEALERIQTPYGGLTLSQWLAARREKEGRDARS
jgi:hypothetical protein